MHFGTQCAPIFKSSTITLETGQQKRKLNQLQGHFGVNTEKDADSSSGLIPIFPSGNTA